MTLDNVSGIMPMSVSEGVNYGLGNSNLSKKSSYGAREVNRVISKKYGQGIPSYVTSEVLGNVWDNLESCFPKDAYVFDRGIDGVSASIEKRNVGYRDVLTNLRKIRNSRGGFSSIDVLGNSSFLPHNEVMGNLSQYVDKNLTGIVTGIIDKYFESDRDIMVSSGKKVNVESIDDRLVEMGSSDIINNLVHIYMKKLELGIPISTQTNN